MKLDVKDNGIIILEKYCFMCMTTHNVTNHHAIPAYLKPKLNLEIPLCRECHTKHHSQDMNNIKSFLFKIGKSLDAVKSMFSRKQTQQDQVTIGNMKIIDKRK